MTTRLTHVSTVNGRVSIFLSWVAVVADASQTPLGVGCSRQIRIACHEKSNAGCESALFRTTAVPSIDNRRLVARHFTSTHINHFYFCIQIFYFSSLRKYEITRVRTVELRRNIPAVNAILRSNSVN